MVYQLTLFFRMYIAVMCMLFSVSLSAQRLYQISGVEVGRDGHTLSNAWTGGLNNPLVSPVDLDQDGLTDIYVYDKAGFKSMAFINTGSIGQPSYRYAPEYDVMFPGTLTDWAVMRDYDGDGVPDIFALVRYSHLAVYHGSRIAGGGIAFAKVTDDLSYTYGVSGRSGIFVIADNMPVLIDVDRDGDMDILTPDVTGTRVSYYQNRSVELGYGRDSLRYVLADGCWGNIYMNSGCGVSYFSCKTNDEGAPSGPSGQRDGGGAMFGFDYEADHDIDILLADISCPSIKFMRNDGDSAIAAIGLTDSLFPSYDRSIKMPIFPAAFGVDADNDGYQDLLIAPYTTNDLFIMKSEDVKCLQYYQNNGATAPLNRFHYMGDSLLTSTTADVGTESHAVFFDYNGDGLQDIVTGNFGRFQAYPSLTLYVNTGTATVPRYEFVTDNWSGLATFRLSAVYPAFGDMDGDAHADMVVSDQAGRLYYFRNAGTDTVSYPSMTATNWMGISAGSGAVPFIYDMDGDSLNDLVIGGVSGYLRYYHNYGTRTTPLFSSDSVNMTLGRIRIAASPALPIEYASPVVHSEGGQLYLYTGSRDGHVEKYLVDRDSLRSGSFVRVSADVLGINPGRHSNVSIADINGDGINDYLLGNIRGGMMLFSDAYWGTGISLPTSVIDVRQERSIELYPVPSRDVVYARSSQGSLRDVHIYDLLGQSATADIVYDEDGCTISVAALPQGIYIVQMSDDTGHIYQRKISVMK